LSYFKRRKIRSSSKHNNNNNNTSGRNNDDGTDQGSDEASSVDLGPDYDNLDTTDSLVEYVSVMRKRNATHKPVDSWEAESTSSMKEEQQQLPPPPTDVRIENQYYQSSPAASLLLSTVEQHQQSPVSMVSSVSNNSQIERCVSWDENVKDVIAKPKNKITTPRMKRTMKMNNKSGGGGDRLLEARNKHNLVGYYL
jgi:hypothetical protein